MCVKSETEEDKQEKKKITASRIDMIHNWLRIT